MLSQLTLIISEKAIKIKQKHHNKVDKHVIYLRNFVFCNILTVQSNALISSSYAVATLHSFWGRSRLQLTTNLSGCFCYH